MAHDDLEPAIILQIGHGQAAHLAAAEGVACPHDIAEAVVDREPVGVAADDHFRCPVARQVGDGDARPHAAATWRAPFEASVVTTQRDDVSG